MGGANYDKTCQDPGTSSANDLKGDPARPRTCLEVTSFMAYYTRRKTRNTLRLSRTTFQNVEQVLEEESGIYIAAVADQLPLSYRYRTLNLKGYATVLL